MSKPPFDSFLPSGAIDPSRRTFPRSDSMISPMMVPRSISNYISAHSCAGASLSTNAFMSHSPSQHPQPSPHPQHPPMSPPKTPSASAEDSTAALVEDWRAYTQRLRSQNEGERAHMAADRARMDEVMAEERALWEKERDILKGRIAYLELEQERVKRLIASTVPPPIRPQATSSFMKGSIDGSSRSVPQESGRNADGSPFYAPAPRHPSRTFDPSEAEELRVDSMTTPRESALRVTGKELRSSDFGIQSPPSGHDLETINESSAESIDISCIDPGLEGVSIKASAVSPTFVSKVMSPRSSPSKLSPDIKPPARDITNRNRTPSKEEKDKKTLEVASQPENRRLTMHAGHTPNHSVSKFSFFGGDAESGNVTPTQKDHAEGSARKPSVSPEHPGEAEGAHESHQGDQELSGPLGLTNDQAKDGPFLAALVEKLEVEAKKSADASPISDSGRSLSPRKRRQEEDDDDEEKNGGPRLRLKPSTNFGRPLGSI